MRLSTFLFTAALLAASGAGIETSIAAEPPAGAGMGMMRGMFTPEERMMMFVDGMKATTGMTDDQRKAYREKRRGEIMAMSEADRAKLKADLDKRWAALPADQKANIQARIQAWRAARQANGGGTGQ